MSAFLNSYQRSPPSIPPNAHLQTPPDQYDFNFVFPVETLRSDRVELRPLVPSLHAQLLYEGIRTYPEVQAWVSLDVQTIDDVLRWIETMRRNPAVLTHAIYTNQPGADTPQADPSEYVFAGMISLINSSYEDMVSELGWIMIFPPFQRTHVLTHSAGTLLRRVLDPSASGGLGLRRCQWFTNSLNKASQAAAQRLGFKLEGVLRQHRVLTAGKEGARDGRKGEYQADLMSRDSWLASITWEEWEESRSKHIDALMARRR